MREFLKRIIRLWPWPLTQNERYDRQTKAVIRKVCKRDSICIDIGCYKGEILKVMMDHAPDARHIAFEPIPEQYDFLQKKFGSKADIFPFALGDENKETSFQHVISNPTYSGLQRRQYKGEEEIREIIVQERRLDDVIAENRPVTLIKIDVEGGEFNVLKGAERILKQWKPYLIFEHGIGGSDKYGVDPKDIYTLLHEAGYKISLMGNYLNQENIKGFSLAEFENEYNLRLNCYFIGISK